MAFFNAISNSILPGSNNTFLGGVSSFPSTFNSGTCSDNTVGGAHAGAGITTGAVQNTLLGSFCGNLISTAGGNTMLGFECGASIVGSNASIGIGVRALKFVDGDLNIGIGYEAGIDYTSNESSNVCIANVGVALDANTIRIGTSGSGIGLQDKTYIAGISTAVITDPAGHDYVMVDPLTDKLVSITQDNSGTIVTTYNTPGAYVWTKNARTKSVQVYGWTGGCGGGGGRKGLDTIAGGGSGGSAGSTFFIEVPASFLGATESVVVGAGGAGGAGQASDDTDGNVGVLGGVSSFGNFIPRINVEGGQGGVNGTGAGLFPWIYINQQLWNSGDPLSGSGTNGDGNNAENAGVSLLRGLTPTGGGGGAGTGSFTGGAGGNILNVAGSGTYLGGGIGGTNTPGSPGNNALTTTSGGIITGGTGGGGGGTGPAQSYNGGNGGFPGGGGGGGGGGLNGTFNSANGGAGGGGLVIVIEFC